MGTHDLRLRLAQIAATNGRSHEAAYLYAQLLAGNPYQPEAWYGLSKIVDEPERVAYCLHRAVDITPGNRDEDRLLLDSLLRPGPDWQESAVSHIVQHWPSTGRS